MQTIIAISGKQFAGKTTLANLMLEFLPGFEKKSLASPLKDAFAEKEGMTREELDLAKKHDQRIRYGLQRFGSEARQKNPNVWINKLLENKSSMIVDDLRYYNEFLAFQDIACHYFIRINADRDLRASRGTVSNEEHPSETELDDFEDAFNLKIINNSGLIELKKAACQASIWALMHLKETTERRYARLANEYRLPDTESFTTHILSDMHQ